MQATEFGTKLAYAVPAPKTHSTSKPLAGATRPSNIPATPKIGQRKPAPPTPPAMADAQAASKAMRPTTKTAGCSGGGDMKMAPRYSSSGKKGKKVMPQPHARRTKKAYTLMNNSCEMIGTIKSDRVHDGMQTALAIEGCLIPDTDLEKIAKFNYMQAERRGKHASFAHSLGLEKEAFGGAGAAMEGMAGMSQPGATPTAATPDLQQPAPPPLPGAGGGAAAPAGAAPMPAGAKPQSPMDFGALLGGMPQAPTGSMMSQPGSTPATPPAPGGPPMPGTGDMGGMGAPPVGGGGPAGMAKAGAHEKQALGGLGTLIGAIGGTAMAGKGNRVEGLGRGVGKGLGWDIGGYGGSIAGGLGGGLIGPALMAAIAKSQGRQLSPEELAAATMTGAGVGGVGGYVGGGMMGKGLVGKLMGPASYDKKNKAEEEVQQEAALA